MLCDGRYTSFDELYASLTIEITPGKVEVYYAGDQLITCFRYFNYMYPPKDYRSYLFYKLNPGIRKLANKLLMEYNVSSNTLSYIMDIEVLEEKLKNIKVTEDIVNIEDVNGVIDAYSAIALGEHLTRNLNYIESFFNREPDGDQSGYHISLRVNKRNVFYTLLHGDKHTSLVVLLKYFVDKSELELLRSIIERIGRASVESYLVFKSLFGMYGWCSV